MQKRFGDNLSPAVKYWLFLVGIITAIFTVISGSFAASYFNLDAEKQALAKDLFEDLIAFPFVGSLFLVVFICSIVSLLFRYYIIPVLQMAEQTRLINAANPDHRITTKGARELVILADIINESADIHQRLQAEIDQKILETNRALKEEHNRFTALMSELPNGVLVCTNEGKILLYNRNAQQMLSNNFDTQTGKGTVGLGRCIFEIFDGETLSHTLELMRHDFVKDQSKPALGLITKLFNNRFIRVNMAPVTTLEDETKSISGFVLSLDDITGEVEADNERDRQLQALVDTVQNSLGNIHQGIKVICDAPGVGHDACRDHQQTIARVSSDLEAHLAMARKLYSVHSRAYGTRENVMADTLLAILVRNLKERFSFQVDTAISEPVWIKIDSYAFVQLLTNLAGLLKAKYRVQTLQLNIDSSTKPHSSLSISWPGPPVPEQFFGEWQATPLFMDTDDKPDTPQSILKDHGGAITFDGGLDKLCHSLSFTLPTTLTEEEQVPRLTTAPRPISYEFDLFHQPGQDALGQVPLRKLVYVAFDTETTGLNPSDGDEIIQIGAIRVVNNRMLQNETIDQLVNPQRPVPKSSVEVHGIPPELLEQQPTITEVLPTFHTFTAGSVLVAHNAAFDMRFLQLKEEITGLHFDNPVLDTLLLSSVVHPNQEGHSLDVIAERFNLEIVGRHTALGDALVTAEILLKLIPLLEAQGIVTLDDALQASANSRFARIKY